MSNLISLIDALLDLDAKGALAPHGIGGHARTLFERCKEELATRPAAPVEGLETVATVRLTTVYPTRTTSRVLREAFVCSENVRQSEELVTRSQAEAIIAAKDQLIQSLNIVVDNFKSRTNVLKVDNAALTARVKDLGAILEGDRTKVIDLMNAISDAFTRRSWLLTSRGSYEWDDDGFRKEFGDAMEEIGVFVEAMRAVGRDWTNCPVNADEIAEARTDWRNRAEALETQLAAARKALEPFSSYAGALFERNFNSPDVVHEVSASDGGLCQLKAKDFFEARAALEAKP